MSKNWSLRETGSSYDQKYSSSDNPGRNIWNKMEKSSNIGEEKKNLISALAYFLTAIAKFNFQKADWALDYLSTLISDFSRSKVLCCSATREATRILSLLYQTPSFVLLVVKSQNIMTRIASKVFFSRLKFHHSSS